MTWLTVDEQQKEEDKRPIWKRQAFHWEAKGRKMFHETLVQVKIAILTSDF